MAKKNKQNVFYLNIGQYYSPENISKCRKMGIQTDNNLCEIWSSKYTLYKHLVPVISHFFIFNNSTGRSANEWRCKLIFTPSRMDKNNCYGWARHDLVLNFFQGVFIRNIFPFENQKPSSCVNSSCNSLTFHSHFGY